MRADQYIIDNYGLVEIDRESAGTDEAGNFSFPSVLLGYDNGRGTYIVTATAFLKNGTMYSGNESATLSRCGDDVKVTLLLKPIPHPLLYSGWVQGHVYDQETGLPLAGVRVVPPLFGGPVGVTNANGYYQLEVNISDNDTIERFSFDAGLEGYWSSSGGVTVKTNQESILDFTLLQKRYGAIAGTVRDAATKDPISNSIVELPGTVPTGADGAYQTVGMELNTGNQPRQFIFQTNAPGYWPNISQATIRADQTTTADVDLIKFCQGATITGKVVNAVSLVPIEGATILAGGKSTTTDKDGMFRLQDLTVGNYNSPTQVTVSVSAAGFYPQSKTVTIFCGTTITLDFGQPHASWGTIVGTVTSSRTGLPLSGVFIGLEFGASAVTDQAGNYRLDKAPLDTNNTDRVWQVTAIHPNTPAQTKSVTVKANQEVRLDFQFDVLANLLPVAQDQEVTTKKDTVVNITLNALDPDGDTLTFGLVRLPAHGTLSGTAPDLSYIPQSGFMSNDSFIFKANDGKADSNLATITIDITSINTEPIVVNDIYSMDEESALNVAAPGILGNDTDIDGDTLIAILVSEPTHGTLTLNGNGSFIYIPHANYNGSDSFTYKANDSKTDSGIATVNVTVNRALPLPDTTPPTTAITLSGTLGNNSWYISDIQVILAATDNENGSGVRRIEYSFDDTNWSIYVIPFNISNEGTTTVYYRSTDNAGNIESIKNQTIKIDKTPPIITGNATTSPNITNWYNTNVTIHFTASDTVSDIDSITPDIIFSAEGINQSITGTAIDEAGNDANFTVTGINIDKTPPTIIGSTSSSPNTNGWYSNSVVVNFTASDVLSGIDTLTPNITISTEGANQSVTGIATDKAGNSANSTVSGINIDKTPPEISSIATTPPNINGWYNSNVTIRFSCEDAVSGPVDSFFDVFVTLEGAGQSVNGTCTDKANNRANSSVTGINIDKTPPLVAVSRTPDSNLNGWNNNPINVIFNATDDLSGVDGAPLEIVSVNLEGANQSVSSTFKDKAENLMIGSISGINIDLTPPNLTGVATTLPNINGWYNNSVVVHFNASDALSGIDIVTPDTTISAEGTNQSTTGIAKDKAGNSANVTISGINIDKTLPIVAITSPEARDYLHSENITLNFSATDTLSGIDSIAASLDGASVSN